MSVKWFKLPCKNTELQLLGTLNGGQSFRWKKHSKNDTEQWIGVFNDTVWVLQQENDHILYTVHGCKEESDSEKVFNKQLSDYFRLDLNLEKCYAEWSKNDRYFAEASKQFYGIRILKQDVTENLFSFICSQNNHISRISGMVEKLAKFYGEKICEIEGDEYYTFPNVEALTKDPNVEKTLRDNGFGYRAKYITKSAQTIMENGGNVWLDKLKDMKYEDAKMNLMTLTGIGAKVADCICLMSLGHLQAIPVDTHIYQIAARLYLPKLAKQKTVSEKIYKEIGDHFRQLYGPLAGWAHTVLFCADLKKFQTTPDDEKKPNKKQKIK